MNSEAGTAPPSTVTLPTAASGATTLIAFVGKPLAGVETVYPAWNCSSDGISISNGSPFVASSNDVEFEYWPTRIGLFAVIVELPSMICWCTWPRLRTATEAPLTWTSVPSCEARKRNVSPFDPRLQRHGAERAAPGVGRGHLLDDVVAGDEVLVRDVRALVPAEDRDRLVGIDDRPAEVGLGDEGAQLVGVAPVQGDLVRNAGGVAAEAVDGRRDRHRRRVLGRGDAELRGAAEAGADPERDVRGADDVDREREIGVGRRREPVEAVDGDLTVRGDVDALRLDALLDARGRSRSAAGPGDGSRRDGEVLREAETRGSRRFRSPPAVR